MQKPEFLPFLLPLRGKPILSPCIAFDVETFGEFNEFDFGSVSTPERDYVFFNPQELLDFMTRKVFWKYNIYATNLPFDAMSLFQKIAGPGKIPKGWSIFDNGSKVIWIRKEVAVETRKGTDALKKKYVYFLDSINLFPAGVEKMGNILQKLSKNFREEGNLELADYYDEKKYKKPIFMGKKPFSKLSRVDQEYYLEYNKSDSRITRKFMEWFCKEIINLGGEPKMTAASTTLDIFRRKYMNEANIIIPQPSWECLVDSKLSYYGGRTENFIWGTVKDVWDNDVTSMYPSAMIEINYPYPSPEHFSKYTNPPSSALDEEGFSFVEIYIPKMPFPPLPFRIHHKLLFPYGYLMGVWPNIELRYAIEQNCEIRKIHWTWLNFKTFNPFKSFVEDLFQKRMQYAYPANCSARDCKYHGGLLGEKCKSSFATEEVVKLFHNGLYGKFGQNFMSEEDAAKLGLTVKKNGGILKEIEQCDQAEWDFTSENYPEYLSKGFVLNKSAPKLKAFMNPILSSYTTARARSKLHSFKVQAKSLGIKILYTDTDSLYSDKRLPFAVANKEMGKLQEGKNYAEILVVGPKTKRLIMKKCPESCVSWVKNHFCKHIEVFTAKGVPDKSVSFKSFKTMSSTEVEPRRELFESLEYNQFETPDFMKFLKIKESFARDLVPNQIVHIMKTFDPLDFPKRRLIGPKPELRDLLRKSFDSEPWEIARHSQEIIGLEQML